jgi:hypothetical protein
MTLIANTIRQIVKLFVDDGWLALAILVIVAVVALLARLVPDLSLAAGAILLFGCLGVLLANVLTSAARRGAG